MLGREPACPVPGCAYISALRLPPWTPTLRGRETDSLGLGRALMQGVGSGNQRSGAWVPVPAPEGAATKETALERSRSLQHVRALLKPTAH